MYCRRDECEVKIELSHIRVGMVNIRCVFSPDDIKGEYGDEMDLRVSDVVGEVFFWSVVCYECGLKTDGEGVIET